jgi:hypothetical protein
MDVNSFKRKIVVIDDNRKPYHLVDLENPGVDYPVNLQDMKIKSFVVPLPKHVYLDAPKAISLVKNIFDQGKYSLKTLGLKFITRLYLTSMRAFKAAVAVDRNIPDLIKRLFLSSMLPHFIWVCELYDPLKYDKTGEESLFNGILILDATGRADFSSILYYIINNTLYEAENNSSGPFWKNERKLKETFQMHTFRHNLGGFWSKWKI